MSLAGWVVPSLNRSTASRAGGAPGLTAASSLSWTPCTTRIVAVDCTLADVRDVAMFGIEAVARAAATISIMSNDNAVAAEW